MNYRLLLGLGLPLLLVACFKADVKTVPASKPVADAIDDSIIVDRVAIESKFSGGVNAWLKFLNDNLTYPEGAEEISGKVVVRFTVEKDGTVDQVQALNGPEILQKEAVRVISLSTKHWQPAMDNGKAVRSYKTQPIIFRLTEA